MPWMAYCCLRYSEAPLYRSFAWASQSPSSKAPLYRSFTGALHGLFEAPAERGFAIRAYSEAPLYRGFAKPHSELPFLRALQGLHRGLPSPIVKLSV